MRTFEFDVMGESFVGITASAEDQEMLFRLLGQSGGLSILNDEYEDDDGNKQKVTDLQKILVILSIPNDFYRQIVKIVSGATANKDLIKKEDGQIITIKNFADNVHKWSLIVAEMIRGNLSSFTQLTALDERESKSGESSEI